ncbi:27 kDa hemolymph protein-like [Diorhabda carinulata]|uniref:27 kDa hemolymph protein-like n=1 Tax=Diorhabda carinulata TaxID=1163345 RepID=UPI0025A24DF9|nr:27 kDa hemolymph protein-like [Diorhabda carinulata]
MNFIKQAVIIFILIITTNCQSLNNVDADKVKDAIEKGLGDFNVNLPDEVDLNSTNLPNAEDIEKILKEKCEKNGAPNAVDLIKEEQQNIQSCLESYVNVTIVEEELENAKKNGSMDEVFAKYCKKWPDILACLDNTTAIARTCMDEREEDAFNKTLNIVNDLQNFMCFKDGDRLAMFVAEGGVECIQNRKDGIHDCLDKTVGSRLPNPDDISITSLPIILFSEKDCGDFETIRACINNELEQCKESTPANIVDAFFKFLKKQLPCQGIKTGSSQVSGSWSIFSNSLLVFVALIYVRLY